MRTAVVLRGPGLGDVLVAVPALRALRRALPGHTLVLAGPKEPGQLLISAGVVDSVWAVNDSLSVSPPARCPRADVAVNLHGSGPQSHAALRTLMPRRLWACANDEAGVRGPAWSLAGDAEHERTRLLRLVSGWTGQPAIDDPADLLIEAAQPATDEPSTVVVHPGAASPARRWPADRFAAVCRSLACDGHQVVVTGAVEEAALVAAVAGSASHSDVRPRACADLRQLASTLAAAGCVVCGDTGVGHLAVALRRSSVHLFGPASPAQWGPPPGPHAVLWRGTVGDPHGTRLDPGLESITVAEVLAAVRALLDGPDAAAFRAAVAG